MKALRHYPVGSLGKPWGENERLAWLELQSIKRLYREEVLPQIDALRADFDVVSYGKLSLDPDRYPVYAVKSKSWDSDLPNVLVTGGVHGYETSGVQGALRFLQTMAGTYAGKFNFLVLPCISPWGYETINRWGPNAVDPNRSFRQNSPSEEAGLVMAYLEQSSLDWLAHFDLHETTDSDNSEFRPALAARDAVTQDRWDVPDGFYTVGNSARPEPAFQAAVIAAVEQVTHIAPPTDGRLIGETLQQHGVINYDAGPLGLCMGLTDAAYVTTTEVYPDSPKVSPEICIDAQVAVIEGGLDFLVSAGI